MPTKKTLVVQARELLYERGQKGLDLARQMMKEEKIPYQPLKDAIDYFMSSWEDVLHPALLSLSCEAVGGKPETTTNVAAALVLLAGGADLHDDIIDQSEVKASKPTVLGKFGKDLTVLAGDALLFKGLYVLYEACEVLSIECKRAILGLTKQAFFGISSAEAKESSLHGRTDAGEEYFEMIKMKSAVSEATMRIGATLGGGTAEEISVLGQCGKTMGILATIRDEFIDLYELNELKNRLKNECLPLPVLVTKDSKLTESITKKLAAGTKRKELENTLDKIIDSAESKCLKDIMHLMVQEQSSNLRSIRFSGQDFGILLKCLVEDL